MSALYRHEGSPEQRDDLLRALGRFVVRFSWLIHTLRRLQLALSSGRSGKTS
jgi:hypothetical protein